MLIDGGKNVSVGELDDGTEVDYITPLGLVRGDWLGLRMMMRLEGVVHLMDDEVEVLLVLMTMGVIYFRRPRKRLLQL